MRTTKFPKILAHYLRVMYINLGTIIFQYLCFIDAFLNKHLPLMTQLLASANLPFDVLHRNIYLFEVTHKSANISIYVPSYCICEKFCSLWLICYVWLLQCNMLSYNMVKIQGELVYILYISMGITRWLFRMDKLSLNNNRKQETIIPYINRNNHGTNII